MVASKMLGHCMTASTPKLLAVGGRFLSRRLIPLALDVESPPQLSANGSGGGAALMLA